ncbi:hypothetical protein [Streptosporangium sp. NPDC049376]|uniref:hypothetical protein n=1 Tax=Streptosporangium sp. NPDC049376 TaxID=3366192 RepID=UPI0037B43224
MRHAYWTRPEQSNAPGPEAPHRYGSPICFLAVATAVLALDRCRAARFVAAFAVRLTRAFAVFAAVPSDVPFDALFDVSFAVLLT